MKPGQAPPFYSRDLALRIARQGPWQVSIGPSGKAYVYFAGHTTLAEEVPVKFTQRTATTDAMRAEWDAYALRFYGVPIPAGDPMALGETKALLDQLAPSSFSDESREAIRMRAAAMDDLVEVPGERPRRRARRA